MVKKIPFVPDEKNNTSPQNHTPVTVIKFIKETIFMKAVCKKDNLNIGLTTATRIIGGNNSLPVLNNILLKTEGGQLRISSTNLEQAINTWIGCKVEEDGDITIPAKLINNYVNNLTTENLTLSTKDHTLFLESSQSKTHIKGLSPEEFPLIPKTTDQVFGKVKGEELEKAIQTVAYAASFSETQPEISGVLFEFSEDTLTIAATDRYRLAEARVKLISKVKKEEKVIVPNRSVVELGRVVGKGEVEIYLSEGQIMFKNESVELISRVIEGQYPDYQQIIPRNFTSEAEIERVGFIQAIRAASLFASDTNNIEIEVSPQGKHVAVRSQSSQTGDSEVVVEAEITGGKNQIIFNHRYLLDCLNNLGDEKIVLKTIDSSSPAAIVPKGREDYIYIVMPIKT